MTSGDWGIIFEDDGTLAVAGTKIWYGNSDGIQYYDSYWTGAGAGHLFRTNLNGTTQEVLKLLNTGNAKLFVWYTIDENLTSVLLSWIMIRYFGMGVAGLLWGQLIASAIVFVLLSIRFLRKLPFNIDFTLLKSSLKLSIPLTPRIFFGVIGNQFDKYMIGLLNTVGGVGIYNLGQKIANVTFTFMTALQNVFTPQVYSKMFNEGELGGVSIGRYLTPFLYVSVAGGLALSLFAEELIILLTPLSYHGSISIVTLFSLLYVTYFFGKQPQLIYAKKTGITSLLTLLSISLNIIINIPFIYFWGLEGAAWGSLVAGILSGSIVFRVSQKYYRIVWEYPKLLLILGSFFIFALLSLAFFKLQVSYELRLFAKIGFLLIFALIGYRLKIVSRENILFIKQSFTKAKPIN
jgi:O-antigen/teichoic acid export membrane protein